MAASQVAHGYGSRGIRQSFMSCKQWRNSSKAGRGFAFHNGMLWFEYEMSPNKLLCLGIWSPAGGAVLGVGGTFWTEEAASSQMWDHVGCTRGLQASSAAEQSCFLILADIPSCVLCFRERTILGVHAFTAMKLWAKITFPPWSYFLLCYLGFYKHQPKLCLCHSTDGSRLYLLPFFGQD